MRMPSQSHQSLNSSPAPPDYSPTRLPLDNEESRSSDVTSPTSSTQPSLSNIQSSSTTDPSIHQTSPQVSLGTHTPSPRFKLSKRYLNMVKRNKKSSLSSRPSTSSQHTSADTTSLTSSKSGVSHYLPLTQRHYQEKVVVAEIKSKNEHSKRQKDTGQRTLITYSSTH